MAKRRRLFQPEDQRRHNRQFQRWSGRAEPLASRRNRRKEAGFSSTGILLRHLTSRTSLHPVTLRSSPGHSPVMKWPVPSPGSRISKSAVWPDATVLLTVFCKKPQGLSRVHNSRVTSRDLVVEADFDSPPGTAWDYGFLIRHPTRGRLEVIGVNGEGRRFHHTRNTGDAEYTEVVTGHLTRTLQGKNHLLVIAIEESGWFFINGQTVDKLDLSHNQDSGSVSAMGDFYLEP